MANNKNILSDMPPWAKGVIGVAAVGIIAFVGYKIYKAVQHSQDTKDEKKELGAADDALKQLTKEGKKPSLDSYNLNKLANQLSTAMDGVYSLSKMGTDMNAVYRAFAWVNNDVDVINLNKTYGIRKLHSGSLVMPDFEGTLTEALATRLNSDEMKALNNMLAKKGIKYRY